MAKTNRIVIANIIKKLKGQSVQTSPKKSAQKVQPTHRERDMRQEAMDIGSHGAKEYFGGKNV